MNKHIKNFVQEGKTELLYVLNIKRNPCKLYDENIRFKVNSKQLVFPEKGDLSDFYERMIHNSFSIKISVFTVFLMIVSIIHKNIFVLSLLIALCLFNIYVSRKSWYGSLGIWVFNTMVWVFNTVMYIINQ